MLYSLKVLRRVNKMHMQIYLITLFDQNLYRCTQHVIQSKQKKKNNNNEKRRSLMFTGFHNYVQCTLYILVGCSCSLFSHFHGYTCLG